MKFLKMVLYIFLGFIALMGFAVWYSQTPAGKARNEAIRAKEHADSIETATQKIEIQQGTTLLIDETFDGKGLLNLPVVNQENNKFFFEEGIYKVRLGGWVGEYFFGIGKELNNFITEVHCDVGGAGICGIALAMPLEREVNKRPANVHFVKTTDGWIISEIPAKGMTHTYENGSRWLKDLTKMKVGSVLRVIKKEREVTCYIDEEEVKKIKLSDKFPLIGDVGLIVGKRKMPSDKSQFGSISVMRFKVWKVK